MFLSPLALLFNFMCVLTFMYGYWIRNDTDIWQLPTMLLLVFQLFFIVFRVTHPLGRINVFIVFSWLLFSLLTSPWDHGLLLGSAFNSFAYILVCLYPYIQETSKDKKTYIREWSTAESHELRNYPIIDIRFLCGSVMFLISKFMDNEESYKLIKARGMGNNDNDLVIAKLSSDHVLFIISCYTYAMLHLWVVKERKDKDLLLKLAGHIIILFSKALNKDKKEIQEIFLNKTTYYIKCIYNSRNIFEIVSSDILNLYDTDEFQFHVLTVNILVTTWATAYMETITNVFKKYYEFNPEITPSPLSNKSEVPL